MERDGTRENWKYRLARVATVSDSSFDITLFSLSGHVRRYSREGAIILSRPYLIAGTCIFFASSAKWMHPSLAGNGRVRPTTVKLFAELFNGRARALCSRLRRLSQFKSALSGVHVSGVTTAVTHPVISWHDTTVVFHEICGRRARSLTEMERHFCLKLIENKVLERKQSPKWDVVELVNVKFICIVLDIERC